MGTYMVQKSYSASAPGTLMLLGEHAVLHDKPAIVLAVDKRITVTLYPRLDQKVLIKSNLGKLAFDFDQIDTLDNSKTFQFVLAVIKCFKEGLKVKKEYPGFELNIDSEFSHECGLGSSAAVTVATVAVLSHYIDAESLEPLSLLEKARSIIRSVQGVGSGADIAASVYGGVIVYQQNTPSIIKKIDFDLPIVVIYSGSKTPTPIVIKKVEDLREKYPDVIQSLYNAMAQIVTQALGFIENKNWQQLGEVMNIQQGIMNALGVGTPLLNQLIDNLNSEPEIYGSKISGSGLGDCVVAIGTGCDHFPQKIPLTVSLQGVSYG